MTRRKTVAIIFAILFLCYYQEWVLVLVINSTTGVSHRLFGSPSKQPELLDSKLLPALLGKSHGSSGTSDVNKLGSLFATLGHPFNPSFSSDTEAVKLQNLKPGDTIHDSDNDNDSKSREIKPPSPPPPPASPSTSARPRSFVLGGSSNKKTTDMKLNRVQQLSVELQSQLAQLQYFADSGEAEHLTTESKQAVLNSFCNRPRIKCGPPIDCEFGCQVHHFITCLLIAYTSNRTLIPDFTYWPYADVSWRLIFKPILGNNDLLLLHNSSDPNCPPVENSNNNFVNINNEISSVSWTKDKVEVCTRDILEYPFLNGVLPVPYEIGMKLKQAGIASPFQWWIGQFAKFVMRPEPEPEKHLLRIRNQFLKLQRSNKVPIAGIMIRRRDKIGEKKRTTNSLDKYMTVVKKYFAKFDALSTTPTNFTRRIYLATDDAGLVLLARKQYPKPKWDILTLPNEGSDMENLVRDMFLLRECDLVLCSFSSDVCRLVSELLETKGAGASSHVKSLDHKYFFDVPDFKGKNKLRIILQ